MTRDQDKAALHTITDFFASSNDFNGILARRLAENLRLTWQETANVLERLLAQKAAKIAFLSYQDNPHILRMDTPEIDDQIRRLRSESPDTFCAYPTKQTARGRSDLGQT